MKNSILILLIPVILLMAGCGREGTAPQSTGQKAPTVQNMPEQVKSLIQEYSLSDSALFDHEYPAIAVTPPSIFDTSFDVYAVNFVWGRLLNTNSVIIDSLADWSGTLSMNAVGVVAPVITIDFEKGQDSLIRQTDPISVSWGSNTASDFDGLSCLIFIKRGIEYFVPVYLTFATPPFTVQYDFSQLEKLAVYYEVDANNGVAVFARRIRPHRCPEGFLIGEWVKADMSGDSGRFDGQWLDENGNLTGIFTGVFRDIEGGRGVLEGWISGPILTVVTGRLFGTWYYDDPRMCPLCGTGMGKFKGIFKYTNQDGVGAFGGELTEDSLGSLKMTMKGSWHLFCPYSTDNADGGE
jgi:hypothetical protein